MAHLLNNVHVLMTAKARTKLSSRPLDDEDENTTLVKGRAPAVFVRSAPYSVMYGRFFYLWTKRDVHPSQQALLLKGKLKWSPEQLVRRCLCMIRVPRHPVTRRGRSSQSQGWTSEKIPTREAHRVSA
ncbi:hypothetical protein PsorP6_001366 [Peronosclerospora sorghi]|uniref:Uncharacterized protein n=1 Tax=Peronosclerospora sorghi TaxID=230839 RepID=A0ACC0WU83_9STRA|nr:hypothetical protein PsorP6_001366 [Peronosclerospora sorghi]